MDFWKMHGIAWVIIAIVCLFASFKFGGGYWLASGMFFYAAGLEFLIAEKKISGAKNDKEEKG